MRKEAAKLVKVWGKHLQKAKVSYYQRAMSVAYKRAVQYEDLGLPAEARVLMAEGDRFRAKWLKAQGADRHPAFNSRHNQWIDLIHDGGFEHQ